MNVSVYHQTENMYSMDWSPYKSSDIGQALLYDALYEKLWLAGQGGGRCHVMIFERTGKRIADSLMDERSICAALGQGRQVSLL
jgi:hypothetical protein